MEIVKSDIGIFGVKLEGTEIKENKDKLKNQGFRYFKGVWSCAGFTDYERFSQYVLAIINGESTKGLNPLKKDIKAQIKAAYKVNAPKRKEWIQNAVKKMYDYICDKWSETIAMVVEEVCLKDKELKFWKLTDNDIDLLALKNIDEIERINQERFQE